MTCLLGLGVHFGGSENWHLLEGCAMQIIDGIMYEGVYGFTIVDFFFGWICAF